MISYSDLCFEVTNQLHFLFSSSGQNFLFSQTVLRKAWRCVQLSQSVLPETCLSLIMGDKGATSPQIIKLQSHKGSEQTCEIKKTFLLPNKKLQTQKTFKIVTSKATEPASSKQSPVLSCQGLPPNPFGSGKFLPMVSFIWRQCPARRKVLVNQP